MPRFRHILPFTACLMAVLLTSSFLALIGILISDLSYAFVDPRISFD